MSTSRPRRAAAPVSQQDTPSRQTRAASSLEPHARSARRQAASRKVSYADVTALSDPDEDTEAVKEEEMDVDEPEDDQEDDLELPEDVEAEEETPTQTPKPRGRPKGKKGRKSGKGGARVREIKEGDREGTEVEGEEGEDVSRRILAQTPLTARLPRVCYEKIRLLTAQYLQMASELQKMQRINWKREASLAYCRMTKREMQRWTAMEICSAVSPWGLANLTIRTSMEDLHLQLLGET